MYLLAGLLRRQEFSTPLVFPDGGNPSPTPTSTQSPAAPTFPLVDPSPSSTPDSAASSGAATYVVGTTVFVVVVVAMIIGFYLLRRTRLRHQNPKYVPTSFLKKAWLSWEPAPPHSRLPDTNEHLEPISSRRNASSHTNQAPISSEAALTAPNNETTTPRVDRNTSVRSVMTLPAYRPTALQNEQVLGREGERAGIDVVIEFPENQDVEEQRREEEMEALYQVRLARRRENEEREERRRLRREARARGDYVALRELQARARASSSTSAGQTVDELRAEHSRIKAERQRAVSSVSYGDLGVARHDGTRVRANSGESERQGLLGDAASIAASSNFHRRDRSTSSVLSIDTMNSDFPSPRLTRSRGNSGPNTPSRRISGVSQLESSVSQGGRAGSSPELIDHDDIPLHSPPEYENIPLETPHDGVEHQEPPPDYSSPVLARGEEPPARLFGHSRTASGTHVGHLMADRTSSGSNGAGGPAGQTTQEQRRLSRGVGGIPQLPSLRLGTLPSIQVEPGSPVVSRPEDRDRRHP